MLNTFVFAEKKTTMQVTTSQSPQLIDWFRYIYGPLLRGSSLWYGSKNCRRPRWKWTKAKHGTTSEEPSAEPPETERRRGWDSEKVNDLPPSLDLWRRFPSQMIPQFRSWRELWSFLGVIFACWRYVMVKIKCYKSLLVWSKEIHAHRKDFMCSKNLKIFKTQKDAITPLILKDKGKGKDRPTDRIWERVEFKWKSTTFAPLLALSWSSCSLKCL